MFLGRRITQVGGSSGIDEGDVGVALDQPWHQRHAAGFDHLGAPSCANAVELAAIRRYSLDPLTVNQDVGRKGGRSGAVPHAAVLEENARHDPPSMIVPPA